MNKIIITYAFMLLTSGCYAAITNMYSLYMVDNNITIEHTDPEVEVPFVSASISDIEYTFDMNWLSSHTDQYRAQYEAIDFSAPYDIAYYNGISGVFGEYTVNLLEDIKFTVALEYSNGELFNKSFSYADGDIKPISDEDNVDVINTALTAFALYQDESIYFTHDTLAFTVAAPHSDRLEIWLDVVGGQGELNLVQDDGDRVNYGSTTTTGLEAIPEPSTYALLLGIASLAVVARRQLN